MPPVLHYTFCLHVYSKKMLTIDSSELCLLALLILHPIWAIILQKLGSCQCYDFCNKAMLIKIVQGIARSLFVVWRKRTSQEIQKLCPLDTVQSLLIGLVMMTSKIFQRIQNFQTHWEIFFRYCVSVSLCLCVSVSLSHCLSVSLSVLPLKYFCLLSLLSLFYFLLAIISWRIFVLMLVVCVFFSLWKSHTGI